MSEPLEIEPGVVLPAADLEVETARSGGPGGQHVNTTDTRVRLRFAIERNAVLSGDVKARMRARRPSALTTDGWFIMTCDSSRSQRDNLDEVRERLAQLIRDCLRAPRPRRATRPTRSSQEKRVKAKKGRGQIKQGRGRVSSDE